MADSVAHVPSHVWVHMTKTGAQWLVPLSQAEELIRDGEAVSISDPRNTPEAEPEAVAQEVSDGSTHQHERSDSQSKGTHKRSLTRN